MGIFDLNITYCFNIVILFLMKNNYIYCAYKLSIYSRIYITFTMMYALIRFIYRFIMHIMFRQKS